MSGDLDPVIHAASRLRIMAVLSHMEADGEMSFENLRQLLDMTAGNLSVHAGKLEQAGYVRIAKTFEGRKPATYLSLTDKGRAAYQNYLLQLRALLTGEGTAKGESEG
ncbi:transcriptional regulator, MarR/emrR family [Bifidobacterium actinocoloniiforme DSM 22766]|uniref:Transcriptional regulator, MarR/emrR family n=1 Tax=Bifidobacterium actinocoloniiforme DSM 22766 TaxID=1437605 RepID=A0A086Z0B5_9BIFI|nr:transcriptional regulator [Bifidobacterium actinocoloniiforme]AKV55216.1 MarR family transcriptional regulator [Bifidobacterium actinocoloniiforme DSM 22766]KFI39965.1 transcriptional regulator, MarR/emrR family [Bifidobacterium actinocoloniiforme DSM 22766]